MRYYKDGEVFNLAFTSIADTSDIPDGEIKMFKVGKVDVLVANVGGKYFAIDNRCSHLRGNLSRGKLSGKVVTCPRHASQFDVTTGKALKGPVILGKQRDTGDVSSYDVRVDGQHLLVDTG